MKLKIHQRTSISSNTRWANKSRQNEAKEKTTLTDALTTALRVKRRRWWKHGDEVKWRTERGGLVQRSVVRREADGFMEKKNEGFAQRRVGTVAIVQLLYVTKLDCMSKTSKFHTIRWVLAILRRCAKAGRRTPAKILFQRTYTFWFLFIYDFYFFPLKLQVIHSNHFLFTSSANLFDKYIYYRSH